MFKNGKVDGLVTYYYENGQKKGEGVINNSIQEGIWTYWWDDTPKRDDPERFNDEVFIPILENEEIPELKSIELRESEIPVSNYLSDSIKDLTYNPNPVEVEDNTIDLPF